jgi:acyl-CoA synthetase (AMP-forming)/AMP-acid ligase II
LSEASPVVSFNPIHGPWKAGSIGVPILGVEVSVQDDSGEILPPGVTGEVCVRGANVMLGYWKQPDETAKVMRQRLAVDRATSAMSMPTDISTSPTERRTCCWSTASTFIRARSRKCFTHFPA